MEITTVGFLANAKRSELEKILKSSDMIDDFDIEELDKIDGRKDVMLVFKTPIDAKYVGSKLNELLGKIEKKMVINED